MKQFFLILTVVLGWFLMPLSDSGTGAVAQAADEQMVKMKAKVTEVTEKSADKKKNKNGEKKEGETAGAEAGPAVIVIPAHKPADEPPAAKGKKTDVVKNTAGPVKQASVITNQNVSDKIKSETQRVNASFESNFQKIYGMPSSGGKDSSSGKS